MNGYDLIFLLVYLSGRLFFFRINTILAAGKLNRSQLWRRILWGTLLLIIIDDFGPAIFFIVMHSMIVAADTLLFPRKINRRKYVYISGLLIVVFVLPAVFDMISISLHFLENPIFKLYSNCIKNLIPAHLSFKKTALVATGYLLSLKEGTIFIRLILNQLSAVPKSKPDRKRRDQAEYERGKIIGLLERTFIYYLIIFNQIGAIAIIVALKSLARFSELNDKEFAEYFLIGSMLSIFAGALPAVIVRLLLNM